MSRETLFWTIVFLLGAAGLIWRAAFTEQGMGKRYVKPAPVAEVVPPGPGDAVVPGPDAPVPPAAEIEPAVPGGRYIAAAPREAGPGGPAVLSPSRTIGLWIAAFLTLAVFSFLYRDNFFYRLAESIFVGVSAAYWMVVAFWSTIVPTLLGRLSPEFVRETFMPGLEIERELVYVVPLILGVMLLWRLAPAGGWIARWPLAFIVGTTAGIRLVGFLMADFLSQIQSTIVPLVVFDAPAEAAVGAAVAAAGSGEAFNLWATVQNVLLVLGVLCGLIYFFFSVEHKGVVGKLSRVGIWVMMITFGAAFGYTVMGRIALLAARLEFLFDDWLWLIDPSGARLFGP